MLSKRKGADGENGGKTRTLDFDQYQWSSVAFDFFSLVCRGLSANDRCHLGLD